MHPLSLWGPGGGADCSAPPSPAGLVGHPAFTPSIFSIKQQFAGAHVLLTGASGYIGSVILEQLLRTTEVGSIRCLLRDKRAQPAEARLARVLQGPLFHKVRDNKALVNKVSVVKGDIMEPDLGLTEVDRAAIVEGVDVIIHCAADIRLECCIQETLTANYEGSRSMLELASECRGLRAYVHVSSAFVNMNFPRHSLVHEKLYPLVHGDTVVTAESLVQELLHLSKGDANNRALVYIRRWDFPNTYTFGKHLAEQLVASYQSSHGLPIAIVRPSLVSAIAGEPYPGYVGNWAGPIGAAAAMASGLFDCLGSVASKPLHVWDVVPADQVASIILASAAAVAAGLADTIVRASAGGTRPATGLVTQQGAVTSGTKYTPSLAESASSSRENSVAAVIQLTGQPGVTGVVKAGSKVAELPRRGSSSPLSSSPPASSAGDVASLPASPVAGAASESGSPMAVQAAAAAAAGGAEGSPAAARVPPLLVVHAATSTTYPLTLMEGWNYNLAFFSAHPPVFSITPWKLPVMTAEFVPSEAAVLSCRRWTGYKVWALVNLLKLFGKEKEAKKLALGFDTFCVHNNAKTDRDLLFATHNLSAMASLLSPAECHEFLLVWKPTLAGADASSSGSKRKGKKGRKGGNNSSGSSTGTKPGSALAPVGGEISWRRYLHTQMAGVYRQLYGKAVEQVADIPGAADNKLMSGEDLIVRHDFRAIK